MIVVGIDPATHIGMVFADTYLHLRCKSIEVNETGFSRLQSIAAEVERTLKLWDPDFVVIEAYAYCKNIDSFIRIVEVGTVIKQILHSMKIPWVEVSPTALKKWTTGNGHADKTMMKNFVEKRWFFSSDNSDIVDAYALAMMGRDGLEELRKLVAPKIKVRKRKKNVSHK